MLQGMQAKKKEANRGSEGNAFKMVVTNPHPGPWRNVHAPLLCHGGLELGSGFPAGWGQRQDIFKIPHPHLFPFGSLHSH